MCGPARVQAVALGLAEVLVDNGEDEAQDHKGADARRGEEEEPDHDLGARLGLEGEVQRIVGAVGDRVLGQDEQRSAQVVEVLQPKVLPVRRGRGMMSALL